MGLFSDLICFIVEYLLIATGINCIIEGTPRLCCVKEEPPEAFLIPVQNRTERQKGPSCSGYASAYVLRHLGLSVSGEEIYREMPGKMRNGAVHPGSVVKVLNNRLRQVTTPEGKGYLAEYRVGSMRRLKYEVSRGIPVIVFVKTRLRKRWLHFVPVVGYDRDFIYIAESLESNVNLEGKSYNRRVPVKEFQKLWNTALLEQPLWRNTYIVVREAEEKN